MVRMLASSAVDSGFEPISGPTKDYKIDIFYSASSLKQQSTERHVAPHIILFSANQSLFFLFNDVCLAEKQQISIL
jgi:hypothetical protein